MNQNIVSYKNKTPWDEYEIPASNTYYWFIGGLHIWCRSHAGELLIAHTHDAIQGEKENPECEVPENITWSRWTLGSHHKKMCLAPVFPDCPIVVKPEYSFSLLKGTEARVYVRIPLWVRIKLLGNSDLNVADFPSVILSKTWFGNFTSGDMCYWISSSVRREYSVDLLRPYLSICPVHIDNKSAADLSFEKLCLRVTGLSLFSHEEQLWSNEIRIIHKGNLSQITISGGAPVEAKSANLITPPRERFQKSFLAKTFSTLKDLPGLGFFSTA